MITRLTYKQRELLDYYTSVSKYILSHLRNRPLLINGHDSFNHELYMDGENTYAQEIRSASILGSYKGAYDEYVFCDDSSTLLSFIHRGYVEFHSWGSTAINPDEPTYIIINLVPSQENTFDQVISLGQAAQEILNRANAISFCKTAGPRHLQVYIPLQTGISFRTANEFAGIVSSLLHEQMPGMSSLDRNTYEKENRILIDYSANKKESATVSVYSIIIAQNLIVSAPIQWKELKPGLDPQQFTLGYTRERLAVYGDIFNVLKHQNNIGKCFKSLGF